MILHSAKFTKSSSNVKQCTTDKKPEFAFIGRSNVGKSSLINMLTNVKGLAKISSTPGKTQLINHFLVNDSWYIVDLPGYGYAKTGKANLVVFKELVTSYIAKREELTCLMVLIDCRLEPQKIDIDFTNWLGENGVPFVLVFTKADKVSANELNTNIEKFKTAMLESWDQLPQLFITSAAKKTGRDEVLDFIEKSIKKIKKNK